MPRQVIVTAMSALILCTQTACVTKNSEATCTVTGAKYLSASASAEDICRSFKERLGQTLAAEGKANDGEGLSIALEMHKRGSLEAYVTSLGDDGPVTHPVIAVDVMDRAMAKGDLDKLADAVAQQLMAK